MLLFSRLYNESVYKFNGFINQLLNDEDLEIGVSFAQQEKVQDSIPDGTMSQSSFKIAIETKLHAGFDEKQLVNHLESFKQEEKKILLALSPSEMGKEIFEKIKKEASAKNIVFLNITFKKIIECFNESINTNVDIQLKEIIDDYEDYCIQEALINDADSKIRIVPCGGSLDLNIKYGIYYMPAARSVTEHGYLGVYKDKKVKGIGKISKIVVAEVIPKQKEFSIKILEEKPSLTDEEKEKIEEIIKETKEKIGWDLSDCPYSYIIVDKFYETNYIKKSKGGIMGHRYQDLKDVLGVDKLPDDSEIAELLKGKEWE